MKTKLHCPRKMLMMNSQVRKVSLVFLMYYDFFNLFYLHIFFLLYSMETQLHLHVHILFSHITCSIISDWTEFPVLHRRIPLLIHPEGNILHLFTPSSQSVPLPPPPSRQPQVYSPFHDFLFYGKVPLCHILYSRYKWYQKRHKHPHVHCSSIDNSQEMESTQMSTDRWLD